jgi:hypothetical protein
MSAGSKGNPRCFFGSVRDEPSISLSKRMMKVRFIAHPGQELEGSLVYANAEHSFRFDAGSPFELAERMGVAGVTSIAVGTLQIEVGVDSHLVLFVWGLHPRARWAEGRVAAPVYRSGIVEVSEPRDLRRGVSVGLADVNSWSSIYDSETSWLRVAPPEVEEPPRARINAARWSPGRWTWSAACCWPTGGKPRSSLGSTITPESNSTAVDRRGYARLDASPTRSVSLNPP